MSYISARRIRVFLLAIAIGLLNDSVFAAGLGDFFGLDKGSSKPTLMQWSYGTSFSGGPDLSKPLATDRPDFTEASSTVGRRVLQIETGYTFEQDKDDQGIVTQNHSYPETLFRYGMFADWFEWRLALNFPTQRTGSSRSIESEELYLGIKLGLTPQEGILPEMAIVSQMSLPMSGDPATDDKVFPGVNWLYGWDVTDSISTAGSTQFNRTPDSETGFSYTEWAQSWTIGYSLTEKLGAYTEWFALFPSSADTEKPRYFFNGGFFYQFTNDIQWDIRSGVGLNDAADDFFAGTGLSVRFH